MQIALIIFVLIVLLLLIPRLFMAFNAWKLKGKNAPTPHKSSARRIRNGEKTVLYFYTPSCGACKVQEPVIQRIRKHHPNAVFKIDASRNRKAAAAYGVMGVPFLAFIENGKIVKAAAGVQSESSLDKFLSA